MSDMSNILTEVTGQRIHLSVVFVQCLYMSVLNFCEKQTRGSLTNNKKLGCALEQNFLRFLAKGWCNFWNVAFSVLFEQNLTLVFYRETNLAPFFLAVNLSASGLPRRRFT